MRAASPSRCNHRLAPVTTALASSRIPPSPPPLPSQVFVLLSRGPPRRARALRGPVRWLEHRTPAAARRAARGHARGRPCDLQVRDGQPAARPRPRRLRTRVPRRDEREGSAVSNLSLHIRTPAHRTYAHLEADQNRLPFAQLVPSRVFSTVHSALAALADYDPDLAQRWAKLLAEPEASRLLSLCPSSPPPPGPSRALAHAGIIARSLASRSTSSTTRWRTPRSSQPPRPSLLPSSLAAGASFSPAERLACASCAEASPSTSTSRYN